MAADVRYVEWLVRLLYFIGGAASTVMGSLVSSKIRVYHDNRHAHLEELKEKVLIPISDVTAGEFSNLVSHSTPVILEHWSAHSFKDGARVMEDEAEQGSILSCEDPWLRVFSSIDEALYEDAKRTHFRKLIADVERLAASWASHVERCRAWVEEMAQAILTRSGFNAYKPPVEPPYVLPDRLAMFAYKRLFGIRTGPLHKSNQGQFWSLEGAPGLPGMIGCSAMASEQQLDWFAAELDLIIAEQRETAEKLREESRKLERDLAALRRALLYAIAGTRLRKRCDLVKFF